MQRHLLLIGSPAVCLATRVVLKNLGATFAFNIGPETFDLEEAIYSQIGELDRYDSDQLDRIQEAEQNNINSLLADFRKAGFVDPVDFRGIRGRAMSSTEDYGIVALAPNPWSEQHLICVCAGVHGPGTAAAIKLLTMPERFTERPWGGVFRVTVASEAPWEERFSFLNPKWDTHKYTPEEYLRDLGRLMNEVRGGRRSRYSEVQVGLPRLLSTEAFVTTRLMRIA